MTHLDHDQRQGPRSVPRAGSVIPDQRLPCHCGTTRRTTETLRVHKWLAHGEQS